MEQVIGAQLLFTPHLVPMSRGLLATCAATGAPGCSDAAVTDVLRAFYADEPFVVVLDAPPSTKSVLGSNAAHVTARYDERTNTVVAMCAIDNLTKGASGGAVQAANVALGLDETAGLTTSDSHRDGNAMTEAASLKASVLVEALPYIRRFVGKIVVVKYGGNALAGTSDDDALSLFAEDIVLMRVVGMRPVVVHGGGPQISELMERLGKKPEFRNGLRVTDAETVDIARMVLIGQVNPQLVAAINVHGPFAVGVSGRGRRSDPCHGPRSRSSASSATSPRSTRGDPGAPRRRLHPGDRHHRHRRRPARRTTSTPTPSPARSPRPSAPRSSSTSPTSRACGATSTTRPA